ncbi:MULTISPECIES: hypothetical protein [unclassified Pseudomonas]|uniref:hypothetical protein n=1 Tax=unclassified Pseudomonas TaxID=196821 RepID=UPI00111C2FB2|nr:MULTISPECIES: hypothetical protein [unclassified Pseudomonas]
MTQPSTTAGVPSADGSPLSTHFGGPTLLFGAYLFFYSWLHLFYYFKTFGISLISLDISIYFYLAFAWTAAKLFGVWVPIILAVGAIVYVGLNSAWALDQKPFWHFIHKVLFVLFLVGGLWGTASLAEYFGTLQAQQVRDGGVLRPVQLHFEEKYAKVFPAVLGQPLQTKDSATEAVLLIETDTTYYVLVQKVLMRTNSQPQRYDSFGNVYQIPKKQVSYIGYEIPDGTRIARKRFDWLP